MTARVYNALRQEVAVLADDQPFGPGEHALRFDGSRLAAGVYVARLEADDASATVRLVVTR